MTDSVQSVLDSLRESDPAAYLHALSLLTRPVVREYLSVADRIEEARMRAGVRTGYAEWWRRG